MFGQMMDRPLLISSVMRHAELQHPNREIVSVTGDQARHRYTFRDAFARVRKLANALARMGAKPGDRIGTLAWNDYRHLETYYAVSCSGFVCHTLNPRLFEDQLIYIANHAEDRWLFIDPMFVPLVEKLQPSLKTIEGYIILTDDAHMPETKLPRARSYESLIAGESDVFEWPDFDERTASSLCYTSGTTGDPKGVLYSHRSTILHCYAMALPDASGLSSNDVVMPVVPMFHVNAWGLPYACAMVGTKIVFPGPKMGDPPTLQALIEEEQVNFAAAVPTVWQGLVAYLQKTGKRVDSLKRVLCGGSAVPLALADALRDPYGAHIVHAWGMTETSPLGTVCTWSHEANKLPGDRRDALRAKQGRSIFGIELKIVDDDGKELPHDGKSFGALKVRGPWVASGYYRRDSDEVFDQEGWFSTGDVATICPLGYMQITDRTKDVIKSGGEWISSIDLENLAVSHPAIAQAAAIAIPHPKWQERPMLVVVLKPGESLTREDVLNFFLGKVAKWWIPDDVVFVEKLPLTATGKLSKLQLRKQFEGYVLPGA
ncbi:fatty-acyl-CoA synthase [Povalibacter uvarum]|uniref:Fatty-acyl-CoA synthase n=1 Tax=Povalibacter uvarum TaxID=732238 RepID=A0A841HGH1_9GAMM|nr:3-(methylthio)propionyl-CoA ligase [Povalibacter uvarum]MBB6091398.1 fatty-acyl-CoA synthase [Povalibacter uvarum]